MKKENQKVYVLPCSTSIGSRPSISFTASQRFEKGEKIKLTQKLIINYDTNQRMIERWTAKSYPKNKIKNLKFKI